VDQARDDGMGEGDRGHLLVADHLLHLEHLDAEEQAAELERAVGQVCGHGQPLASVRDRSTNDGSSMVRMRRTSMRSVTRRPTTPEYSTVCDADAPVTAISSSTMSTISSTTRPIVRPSTA